MLIQKEIISAFWAVVIALLAGAFISPALLVAQTVPDAAANLGARSAARSLSDFQNRAANLSGGGSLHRAGAFFPIHWPAPANKF